MGTVNSAEIFSDFDPKIMIWELVDITKSNVTAQPVLDSNKKTV